jgi:hypothetical protein
MSSLRKWTTYGFWWNSIPVSVGVVRYDENTVLYGGGTIDELGDASFQGAWSTSAEADDWEAAEAMCIAEMLSTLNDDEEEED